MATAAFKAERVERAGPSRGWRRRLRTLGVVVIVATTVLVAAVYAASWPYRPALVYTDERFGLFYLLDIRCDRGLLSASRVLDPSPGALIPIRSLQVSWRSTPSGARGFTWIELPSIARLSTLWPSFARLRLEIPLLLLVATSAWLIARRVRAARVVRRGGCPSCGYDLSGLKTRGERAICPECGHTSRASG